MKRPFLVDSLIRMSTKVISLCLDQIRGQAFGSICLQIVESGRKCQARNVRGDRKLERRFQDVLLVSYGGREIVSEKQICQFGFRLESFSETFQHRGSDDTSAAPDLCDLDHIKVITLLCR